MRLQGGVAAAAAVWAAAGVVLCVGSEAGAQVAHDPLAACLGLSFAPLEVNIPACTALIEESAEAGEGGRDAAALAGLYAARAEAYWFALTYRGDSEVSDRELLAAAIADLDAAAALDPGHHAQRAGALYSLERYTEAAEGYTAAIAVADPAGLAELLHFRSVALEAAGDLAGALEDTTAAVRISSDAPGVARHRLRRAALREQVRDLDGALADYQAVLRLQPDSVRARDGVERLTP